MADKGWPALLALGVAVVAFHVAGKGYLLGYGGPPDNSWLGVFPYPEWLLVALLWAGAFGGAAHALAATLLAVGGWGWGVRRLRGPGRGPAGAALAVGAGLAPPLALALSPATSPGEFTLGKWWAGQGAGSQPLLTPGGDWAVPLLALAVATLLAPAATRRLEGLLYGSALIGVLGGSVLALAGLGFLLQRAVPAGIPQPLAPLAFGMVALFGLLGLAALAPRWRRPWALLGLAGGLPALALTGAAWALVPRAAVVASDFLYEEAPLPEGDTEGAWFTATTLLGESSAIRSLAAPWQEGYAERLTLPPAGLSLSALSPLPDLEALALDSSAVPASRRVLRHLASLPGATDSVAILFLNTARHDPLLGVADLAFVAELPELFAHRPSVGRMAGTALLGRGEAAAGDSILSRVSERQDRASRILAAAGLCAWPCEARGRRGGVESLPHLGGPALGQVTVRLALSRVPGAETGLQVGVAPVAEGADGGLAYGPVTLVAVRDGIATIGPLPAGRYALRVGYREGEGDAYRGLSVSGVPAAPFSLRPGAWEQEALLSLWPEDPLEAWCEDGHLEWAPLPLAAAYTVEGWQRVADAPGVDAALEMAYGVSAPGPHVPLEGLIGERDGWPSGGFWVVALDDFGRQMARFQPLTRQGWLRGNSEAGCAGVAGSDRVGG